MSGFVAAGRPVSRETIARLEAYEALLHRWSPRINLVAASTLAEARTRHFADSAQLIDLAPPEAGLWADLGSGAGFPGLVIAVLAAEERPGMKVTLVESDARKAAFLAAVLRETGVAANVLTARAEDIAPLGADVVSARALAPLPHLLSLAVRHLAPGGVCLFPKGAGHGAELARARESWSFDLRTHPSRTDPQGVVLEIRSPRHE